MKIYNSDISGLSEDCFVRFDVDNIAMRQTSDFTKFSKLAEYITFIETGKPISREDYSLNATDNVHLLVRNIVKGEIEFEDVIYITDDKAEELKDYRIQKGDVLIAISAACGASCLYDGLSDLNLTLSHYLCRIRVDESRLSTRYLVHFLNSSIMQKYFRGVETGKSQKNLSKVYIRQAPIVVPTLPEQNNLLDSIHPHEVAIRKLKAQLKSPQLIIDGVFAREFGFDYAKFDYLKTHTRFNSSFSILSNNPDMRFSPKFHRTAGAFVMQQLTNITDKRIKHFMTEPIVLGTSISPNDYSDDGDYYYISMATIKNWSFDPVGANLVSNSYSTDKQAKTVKKNDIIMARSGEGTIGKVALIDAEDLQGVFADFTMRIRLTNYNPRFAYYYFRTTYFQYLVEVYKKGLGNNTNIFPITVQEFPIPNILLTEQNRIVDEILSEISKQDSIRTQIAELRGKIDSAIESTIAKI